MKIRANGIQVEVEDSGDVSRPPVVDALVDAGYRVIRHDNRDIGLSQHFDELGVPNLALAAIKHKLGMRLHPPYTLIDMAKDALGVLDALAIPQAHVVGVSMGGMIAQRMAIAAPGRVLSLTSVMSSSGARRLPSAEPRVLRAMLGRPANASHEAAIDHTTALFRLIGSPGFPLPEAELRERVRLSVARSHHPAGISRQMLAWWPTTAPRRYPSCVAPPWWCTARPTRWCLLPAAKTPPAASLALSWWASKAWATTCRPAWCSACWPRCCPF